MSQVVGDLAVVLKAGIEAEHHVFRPAAPGTPEWRAVALEQVGRERLALAGFRQAFDQMAAPRFRCLSPRHLKTLLSIESMLIEMEYRADELERRALAIEDPRLAGERS